MISIILFSLLSYNDLVPIVIKFQPNKNINITKFHQYILQFPNDLQKPKLFKTQFSTGYTFEATSKGIEYIKNYKYKNPKIISINYRYN